MDANQERMDRAVQYIEELLAHAPDPMTVKEANQATRVGRDRIYRAAKARELAAIVVPGEYKDRYLIPKKALVEWLTGMTEAAA